MLAKFSLRSSCRAARLPAAGWVALVLMVPLQVRADWPRAAGPVPVVSMRVHAVFCADDNGARRTDITPVQVQAWVDKANEIYAGSNVHFDFDPARDWGTINNTLVNSLSGANQSDWVQARDAANAVAAVTPHDLVALFRWGPDSSANTGGFSWTDYNFIAMPTFYTYVGGHQNIGVFAHEAGHYLGLAHTFAQIFPTVADAQTYFVNNGSKASVFDGDGRIDTPPDPYVVAVQSDTNITSLNLAGTVFPLPRSNIMSYYEPHSDLSLSQIATVRQTLVLRSGQNLTQLVSNAPGQVREAEDQHPAITGGSTLNQNMSGFLGKWSGDSQLFWIDGGANGRLSFDFQVAAAGKYDIYGGFTAAPDYGIFTHVINGQSGSPLDLYSSGVLPTGAVYLGQYDLTSGTDQWLVQASGSNPLASPRYGYGLDYMLLVPVVTPAHWASAVSGSWSTPSNWTGGVPNASGAGGVINASTTAELTITLDAPQTVGTLVLGNSASRTVGYSLVGSGSNLLTLNNSGSGATITVTDGSHVIHAPVVLANNLLVSGSGSLRFSASSSITGGYSLTMSGQGLLTLEGTDSYTGGTIVSGGTLNVAALAALPVDRSLSVTGSGIVVFGAGLGAGAGPTGLLGTSSPDPISGAAASPTVSTGGVSSPVASVPEPSTLALLGVATIGLAGYGLRKRRERRLRAKRE